MMKPRSFGWGWYVPYFHFSYIFIVLFYVTYLKNPTGNFVGAQLKHQTVKWYF